MHWAVKGHKVHEYSMLLVSLVDKWCTTSYTYLRIDCYFRAHMEYKRPDIGLKIPWSALALLGEFSNLRLGVYTPYAHENSNQSLYLHLISIIFKKLKPVFWQFARAIWRVIRSQHINSASGTANTCPCNETIGFEQWCHLWNLFIAVWQQ